AVSGLAPTKSPDPADPTPGSGVTPITIDAAAVPIALLATTLYRVLTPGETLCPPLLDTGLPFNVTVVAPLVDHRTFPLASALIVHPFRGVQFGALPVPPRLGLSSVSTSVMETGASLIVLARYAFSAPK